MAEILKRRFDRYSCLAYRDRCILPENQMGKQSAKNALQFMEDNYCMIHSLEAKSEKGCTDRVIAILKKHIKENCNENYDNKNECNAIP